MLTPIVVVRIIVAGFLGILVCGCQAELASAPTPTDSDLPSVSASPTATSSRRILTRIFFQDDEARTLKWADVLDGSPPELGSIQIVADFPTLDADRQSLVQMESAEGLLLIGVRDDDGGAYQSGWVLVDTGVDAEDHGSHSHWYYHRPPRVRAAVLDEQQGNPAHLYCYQDVFYLANDRLNGYTRLDPAAVAPDDDAARIRELAAFHQGGGGHITLAVTDDGFGYASWIDRKGDNAGRVDVTALSPTGNTEIAYSFHLPYGGIHGATYNQGKVFLTPADGLCWVSAGGEPSLSSESTDVQHLSLGDVDGKPRRTGAFTNFDRHVAFVTGSGADAELNLIDAAAETLELARVPLDMAEGNRPAGLSIVRPRRSSPLAYVFHDHPEDVDAPNLLTVVELDPNRDGDFTDAQIAQVIEVGRCLVEGHSGHHSIDFDEDRRYAMFTNPSDGTLVLFSLDERTPIGEFTVGGAPSKVLVIGGREDGR